MKKITRILILLCIPLVFSLFFFGTKSGTWSYNGGSGPQIVVTYNGSNSQLLPILTISLCVLIGLHPVVNKA